MGLSRHKYVVSKLLRSAIRARNNPDQNDFFDVFCSTLQDLGGVYVKFLQGLMLDRTMKTKNERLLDIFENNVFADLDPIAHLRHQLGLRATEVQLLSRNPIAAGSYSAVYRATLTSTGEELAVKILRPNIEKELKSDLNFLRILARIYKLAEPKNMLLDIARVYGAFRKSCIEEIDFKSEIYCMEYLGGLYKNHETIVVPKVYSDLCTSQLIVQEWIGGMSATDILQAKIDGYSPVEYVRSVNGTDLVHVLSVLGDELLWGSFGYEMIHGDPHPGNVRVLANNKIALIDYGLHGTKFAPKMIRSQIELWKNDLDIYNGILDPIEILKSFMHYQQYGLYKALECIAQYMKVSIDDVFTEVVLMMKFDPENATQAQKQAWYDYGSGSQVIKDTIKNFKEFGLNASVHSLGAQRSHHTFVHLIGALGLKKEIWPGMLDRIVKKVTIEHPELLSAEKKMVLDQALEYLYGWSEKLSQSNSDMALKLQDIFQPRVSTEQTE
jgi:hypothetical protein